LFVSLGWSVREREPVSSLRFSPYTRFLFGSKVFSHPEALGRHSLFTLHWVKGFGFLLAMLIFLLPIFSGLTLADRSRERSLVSILVFAGTPHLPVHVWLSPATTYFPARLAFRPFLSICLASPLSPDWACPPAPDAVCTATVTGRPSVD
jgi:hypothetical protein